MNFNPPADRMSRNANSYNYPHVLGGRPITNATWRVSAFTKSLNWRKENVVYLGIEKFNAITNELAIDSLGGKVITQHSFNFASVIIVVVAMYIM